VALSLEHLYAASSRSHCIIILHVERTPDTARTSHSRLMLCDLAGSERQKMVRVCWHMEHACADLHAGHLLHSQAVYATNSAAARCALQTAAEGLALEEGKQINRSLSALSNVVQTLTGQWVCMVFGVLPNFTLGRSTAEFSKHQCNDVCSWQGGICAISGFKADQASAFRPSGSL
jgi:Kinesin motor domain